MHDGGDDTSVARARVRVRLLVRFAHRDPL
jgi:hypothetical protein